MKPLAAWINKVLFHPSLLYKNYFHFIFPLCPLDDFHFIFYFLTAIFISFFQKVQNYPGFFISFFLTTPNFSNEILKTFDLLKKI